MSNPDDMTRYRELRELLLSEVNRIIHTVVEKIEEVKATVSKEGDRRDAEIKDLSNQVVKIKLERAYDRGRTVAYSAVASLIMVIVMAWIKGQLGL